MSTTKYEGLWAQGRQGFYAGKVINKKDIPNYTRLVIRYNKFYEKDGNRPRFVYCFADAKGYENKCVPLEYEENAEGAPYKGEDGNYYTESGDRLYTRDDARAIIDGTFDDVKFGISDPWDILPEDFA